MIFMLKSYLNAESADDEIHGDRRRAAVHELLPAYEPEIEIQPSVYRSAYTQIANIFYIKHVTFIQIMLFFAVKC